MLFYFRIFTHSPTPTQRKPKPHQLACSRDCVCVDCDCSSPAVVVPPVSPIPAVVPSSVAELTLHPLLSSPTTTKKRKSKVDLSHRQPPQPYSSSSNSSASSPRSLVLFFTKGPLQRRRLLPPRRFRRYRSRTAFLGRHSLGGPLYFPLPFLHIILNFLSIVLRAFSAIAIDVVPQRRFAYLDVPFSLTIICLCLAAAISSANFVSSVS